MLEVLRPMHQMMQRGAVTKREMQFQQQLGRDLQDAHDWCNKYEQSGHDKDLQQAWELYYTVFRNISKQVTPHSPTSVDPIAVHHTAPSQCIQWPHLPCLKREVISIIFI
jgi:hypothetical protein